MRRKSIAQIIGSVALVGVLLGLTIAAGSTPLLGLDLQGGISVVLEPTGPVEDGRLDQAVEIIRNRIDSLGVAEPEITTRGTTILVQIPGIEDRERALELVGQTAELRFRPVLAFEPAPGELPTDTTVPTETSTPSETTAPSETTLPSDTTVDTTTEGSTGTTATLDSVPPSTGADEQGYAPGENAGGSPATTAPDDETQGPTAAPSTQLPPTGGPTTAPPTTVPPFSDGTLASQELTDREGDTAEATVLLPQFDDDGNEIARYSLGPAAMTGDALRTARAVLDQTSAWVVNPTFKAGSPGIDDLNAIAPSCVSMLPECPTGQLAIVLDGEVISAPGIQQPSFERDSIQITGDFTESEAKDLALVLRYGALPVELEPQAAQVVSATVGEDALAAGLVAGAVGLALASLYMFGLYRLLGVVAVVTLVLTAGALYVIVAWLSETRGLALTLAGVTGLIVSIGISLDSNIVYFEHLKEDVRNGRTVRSAVDKSFQGAFRTIVAADTVSLLGAAVLYLLTLGAVRGFALYLGLATVLDLVAAWFFMRPAVKLLGNWKRAQERPGLLGLPGPDPVAEPAEVPA